MFRLCPFTLVLAFALFPVPFVNASGPPNILLIFSDDQGVNDISAYGSEVPTPHIDRIGEEGVRFTRFYAASSICTPSRFGLLTGTNPLRSQDALLGALMFLADEDKNRGIRPGETTIAEVLRDRAGYDTALIGKWHLGHGDKSLLPVNHGFDTFIGHTGGCIDFFTMTYGILPDWYHGTELVSENGYATELISDEAIRFLGARKEREKPFFLYLAYNAPHFGKGYSPAAGEPVNLMQPQAAELQRVDFIEDKIRREFAAMTVSLDDGIGRVLDALEREGLKENTWVIFLTDHGGDPTYGGSNLPLRGNKATLFEGGLKVPCVMRWPGKIEPGTVSDELLWALDFFPSFCEAAGLEDGLPPVDGESFLKKLAGEGSGTARKMLWQTGAHEELGRKSWMAYRDGSLKYVSAPGEGEFLFDLDADPNEASDLREARSADFLRLKEAALFRAREYRRSATAGK